MAQPLEKSIVVKEAKIEALKSLARSLLDLDQIELFENAMRMIRKGEKDPQRIVSEGELRSYLGDGWQFVSVLPSKKILIR